MRQCKPRTLMKDVREDLNRQPRKQRALLEVIRHAPRRSNLQTSTIHITRWKKALGGSHRHPEAIAQRQNGPTHACVLAAMATIAFQ